MDIISMAQQARPNPSGQMELLRAQFTALSSWVKMMPSSRSKLPKSSGLVSVACFPREVLMLFPSSHLSNSIFAQDLHSKQMTLGARSLLLLPVAGDIASWAKTGRVLGRRGAPSV